MTQNYFQLHKLWWKQATILVFCFAALFPTLRAFIYGDAAGSNFSSILFSILPDLFFASLSVFSLWLLFRNHQLEKLDFIFLGYIGFNVIYGIILSQHTLASVYGFRLTYLPMFIYFIGRLAMNENCGQVLLKHLMYVISGISVVGLLLYFPFHYVYIYIIGLLHDYEFEHQMVPRMTSLFYTPLVFSSVVAISSLYFLILFQKNKKRSDLILFIINCVCLILSISRGAILAFMIVTPVLIFLLKDFKRILFPILSVILISTICINVISPKQEAFFLFGFIMKSSVNTMEMDTNIKRVDFWQTSITDFKNRPWGYGLGKSGHVANRLFKGTDVPAAVYATDGWYLKLLNETGVPGFIAFIILMTAIFQSVIKIQNNYDRTFFIGLLIIIGFQSIVSNVPDFTFASFFIWIIFGLRSVNSKKALFPI